MLLFIVKRLGVSCRRGGDGVDPLGGALLEFGQVAGSAFDFTDPAGGHGQRLADLLLRDPVAREYLRDKLRLTAVVANELEIMDGKFTGNVIGDIVDAQYKAKTLTRLAQEYEIPLAQTVAIGDGANDLPMIKAAGLGIAYHAKPKVNEKTEVTIRHADLMGVFCILSGSLNQK